MRYAMALTTRRKLLQHTLWMYVRVARIARRNGFVLIFVTEGTGKIVVLGRILSKQVQCLLMTAPTVMRRGLL